MNKINITVLSVTISTVPTAKGSYQVADTAYKNNTFQGKIEGKKVMSFGDTAAAFKVLAENPVGVTFDVDYIQTQGKDGKTYNNWVSMQKAGIGPATGGVVTGMQPKVSGATAAPRSNYETPEERAQRQVFIVRQSSVSNAVAALSAGAKAPVKIEEALEVAKKIEAYVFAKPDLGGATGFDDLPDFPMDFNEQTPNVT